MKKNKYYRFKLEIGEKQTRARRILDKLENGLRSVRRQNKHLLRRLADIVCNQRHYLRHRLPQTEQREAVLRNLQELQRRMSEVMGRIYIEQTNEPKYFLKLSRPMIYRLMRVLKDPKP